MQESFCLSMNHLEVGHLGLQLPALSFLSFPSSSRARARARTHTHTHTHTCVCLTAKLTALPRAHPSPGALDMYHTARKIRCRWECSVPRGVPFSRDQDSLATAGGTLPPLGGSLPSTAGRAPSLRRSTSLPLRSRASPLALCVHARGQLGWRLSLFG